MSEDFKILMDKLIPLETDLLDAYNIRNVNLSNYVVYSKDMRIYAELLERLGIDDIRCRRILIETLINLSFYNIENEVWLKENILLSVKQIYRANRMEYFLTDDVINTLIQMMSINKSVQEFDLIIGWRHSFRMVGLRTTKPNYKRGK